MSAWILFKRVISGLFFVYLSSYECYWKLITLQGVWWWPDSNLVSLIPEANARPTAPQPQPHKPRISSIFQIFYFKLEGSFEKRLGIFWCGIHNESVSWQLCLLTIMTRTQPIEVKQLNLIQIIPCMPLHHSFKSMMVPMCLFSFPLGADCLQPTANA